MATDPADGPGELNCNHVWRDVFSLNDHTASMPRAILDPEEGITGLHDMADMADPREKRTAQIGESTYPQEPGGKTVVYVGEIEAANEQSLNFIRQVMKADFMANRSVEGFMKIVPHASYGDDVWGYFARPLSGGLQFGKGVHRSKNHPHTAFARTFQLSLRMSDPRFYLVTGGQSFLDNDAFDVITVPNYDAPADPKFTVNLPVSGETVTLTNNSVIASNGLPARLRFGPFIGVSGVLVVDFKAGARRATMAGVDVMQYFDSSYSTWWDELIPGLAEGNNDVTVSGGGQWDLEYFPRCW